MRGVKIVTTMGHETSQFSPYFVDYPFYKIGTETKRPADQGPLSLFEDLISAVDFSMRNSPQLDSLERNKAFLEVEYEPAQTRVRALWDGVETLHLAVLGDHDKHILLADAITPLSIIPQDEVEQALRALRERKANEPV